MRVLAIVVLLFAGIGVVSAGVLLMGVVFPGGVTGAGDGSGAQAFRCGPLAEEFVAEHEAWNEGGVTTQDLVKAYDCGASCLRRSRTIRRVQGRVVIRGLRCFSQMTATGCSSGDW